MNSDSVVESFSEGRVHHEQQELCLVVAYSVRHDRYSEVEQFWNGKFGVISCGKDGKFWETPLEVGSGWTRA